MHFPSELPVILKLLGALLAGLGSLVLAWRVKKLLTAIVDCLLTHDMSIKELLARANGGRQTMPAVVGMASVVLDIQDKIGLRLLVVGFVLFGVGLLCTALSYLV